MKNKSKAIYSVSIITLFLLPILFLSGCDKKQKNKETTIKSTQKLKTKLNDISQKKYITPFTGTNLFSKIKLFDDLINNPKKADIQLHAKELSFKKLSKQARNCKSLIDRLIYSKEMLEKASNSEEKALAKIFVSDSLFYLKNIHDAKVVVDSIPDDQSTSRAENFTLQKKHIQEALSSTLMDYDSQLGYLKEIIIFKTKYEQTETFFLTAKEKMAKTLVLLGKAEEAKPLLKEVADTKDKDGLFKYHISGAQKNLENFSGYTNAIFVRENFKWKDYEKKNAFYEKYGSDFMQHLDEYFIQQPKGEQAIIFSNKVLTAVKILNN